MVPSVIYISRKFLEAVIPIGLGAFLCHSLNDLVSDSYVGHCAGASRARMHGGHLGLVLGPPRSCLVRGTTGEEEFSSSPLFFMRTSRRGRCDEAHSQDVETAVLTRL